MTNTEFQNILARYQREECTPKEREMVEKWIESIQSREIPFAIDEVKKEFELMDGILRSIQPAVPFSKRKIVLPNQVNTKRLYWAAAAMVVISCGLYFLKDSFDIKDQPLQKNRANTGKYVGGSVQNIGGGIEEVKLSDGSIIQLEQSGRIVIAPDFNTAKERVLHLEGTAFFRVAHDANRPFIVTTKKLLTKVLGTSFTISAEKGKEESVKVRTGKVAVYCQRKKNQSRDSFVAITANHQIRFDSASRKWVQSIVEHPSLIPTVYRKAINKTSLVLDGRPKMKFEQVSAIEILKALEDAYGIKIKFDESRLSKCVITASMKDDDFYTWLQTVCGLIGGSYQTKSNEIEIISPRCG